MTSSETLTTTPSSTSPTSSLTSTVSQTTTTASSSTTTTPTTTTTTTILASINATDPTGGISMLTPAPTLGSQFYRVGTPITLAWNYTSLLRTPTAIDILATYTPSYSNALPAPAFTLALNASFAATQTITWDTGAYALQTPLPVGAYTLIVYDADAEGGATATARPGYLGTQEGLVFGVYTPQVYVPLADGYVCATCNAAGGKMERLTWGVLGGSLGVSLVSFVWFAGGWGVLF